MKKSEYLIYCILAGSCLVFIYCCNLVQVKATTVFPSLKLEHRMISSGDNFPDFDPAAKSIDQFLMALHQGEVIDNLRFPDEKQEKLKEFLIGKNWLHYKRDKLKPSVFIISKKDGAFLYERSTPVAVQIANEIANRIQRVKSDFTQLEISEKQPFEKWSFLILSDVLLDSWQIENVERHFLKQTERPERHGKHYFFAIMENCNPAQESFGIYGNQFIRNGNKLTAVYGKKRVVTSGKIANRVSKKDDQLFTQMANEFSPVLMEILENNREFIQRTYEESTYYNETSFEEFFIWWYHFIYTKATDIMAEKGLLEIPAGGNFEYEVIQ